MKELNLKYGCNPHQIPAKIYMENNEDLPIKILNSNPGYINLMDALNSWQLVHELKKSLNYPAAASFKHLSPAGAAIGTEMTKNLAKAICVDDLNLTSKIAIAYAKARGADRMSSFGDWAALSDTCDYETALILKREVSDGIIAPDFTKEALEILKTKKQGKYNIIQIDEKYNPKDFEKREVFGITFEQKRNNYIITEDDLKNIVTENKNIPKQAKSDLILASLVAKYTQSNSVCYAKDGMAIGIGAGQQSRIHCTRLAGNKADAFYLRQTEKVLSLPFLTNIKRAVKDNTIDLYINESEEFNEILKTGKWKDMFYEMPEVLTKEEKEKYIKTQTEVSISSDAFFPFDDNIKRAAKSGVLYIAQPGGSISDKEVINSCNDFKIAMVFTNQRLFHH